MTHKNKDIAYPKFVLKFKLGEKWVNTLHTRLSSRIRHRIALSLYKFKWDKSYLEFHYDKKYTNRGYYYNYKELLHAFICFKEIIPEFKVQLKTK